MNVARAVTLDSFNTPYNSRHTFITRLSRNSPISNSKQHDREWTNFSMSTISPDGWKYRLWEFIGIAITLSILFDLFIVSMHSGWVYWTHPLTDLYFVIDIFIRFHTEYIDDSGNVVKDLEKIRHRYFYSWFLFDLILSLPYGFLRHCWESRPALKLLAIREKTSKSVIQIFISRSFRKNLIETFKAHVKERTFWTNLINGQITPAIKQSRIRKAARLSTSWYRALTNLRMLKSYSSIVKSFISFGMSIRTLSLLSVSKRRL